MELPFSFNDLVYAKASVEAQITLVILQALLWYCAIPQVAKVIKQYVKNKPYREQFVELSRKTWEASFKQKFDDAEVAFDYTCLFGGIILQHCLGGFLCLPSIIGVPGISPELAGALARHGALTEAGWELQDAIERAYTVIVKKDWSMNHPDFLFMVACHHVMGLSLVIPLNLYFGDLALYHHGVFYMQGVAAFGLSFQYYAFTLNLKERWGLLQMKMVVISNFVLMFYCRIIGFGRICIEMIPILWSGTSALFFIMAVSTAISMQYLNYFFILEAYNKCIKYTFMPLPKSAKKSLSNRKKSETAVAVVTQLKRVMSDIVLQGEESASISKKKR